MMFKDFFEFVNTPFAKDIPTANLFMTEDHKEVFSRLTYATERKMFTVITGQCGTGKSTLLRKLKDSLDSKKFYFLYLADSKLTPRHFYNGLLLQLGRNGAFYRGDSRRKLHQEIELLQGIHSHKLVVAVDEAHLLNLEMLEEIRFLLNYKMDSESPLALILAGQTELEEKINRMSSAAIRQRIDLFCRVSSLNLLETAKYIEHHLLYAGVKNTIFSDSAINQIFLYSNGSTRLINKACSNCLLYGYVNKIKTIDRDIADIIVNNELYSHYNE
jgi:type II secretory pathway predicted ATPase ExeA